MDFLKDYAIKNMNFLKDYAFEITKNSEFTSTIKGIKFANVAVKFTKTKSVAKALIFSILITFLAFVNSANALNLQNKFTDFSADNDFYEDDSYIFTKNAYIIKDEALKHYANAKDAITAAPFANAVNLGYGDFVDMRANGLRGAKLYINGFDASPALTNFSGFSPLTFIPVAFIDELYLQPQSFATRLGSGTKGGVIGINTLSRQEAFELSAGYEQNTGYKAHILYNGGGGQTFQRLFCEFRLCLQHFKRFYI